MVQYKTFGLKHYILFVKKKAPSLPQEGGQAAQGSDENGQATDEERGEGRHQVRVRLGTVSDNAGDRKGWCIFLLNLAFYLKSLLFFCRSSK